jgi:glycosyltransferase involved in cell wall biosynthesis
MNAQPAVNGVSLVIPGKNASRTLRQCLDSVIPLLGENGLKEILFVDDGSSDDTSAIAASYPVRYIRGEGKGPGHARNLGWRASASALIWFIDSDCVAEPDSVRRLLASFAEPHVGGAGGTYGNMVPNSLLGCLIHEEIVERHRFMAEDVDYLASYNVMYRREILERTGGFDERYFNGPGSPGAEDIELAFRVHDLGYRLKFERDSVVKHYHPTRLGRYLRSQRHHGYWRVWLYLLHPRQARGDSYSQVLDHLQPPLALLAVATLPLVLWRLLWFVPAGLGLLLLLAQLPQTLRLVRRLQSPKYLWFAPMGVVRALWRGAGMAWGVCSVCGWRLRGRPRREEIVDAQVPAG